MSADKDKALQAALKEIDKKFGKHTLIKIGDKEIEKIPAISTGSIGLDTALGIGGLPIGRVIEIFGPESSGKTTLALQTIAEAQKNGMRCGFIDAEHAIDIYYAKNLGVNTDELYLSQPDYGEQALEIVSTMARSGAFDLIVIDSVAALTPKAEIEGEIEDQQVGVQARLMSKALRRLASVLHDMNVMVIFINQLRQKIGVMGYGPNETTTGGQALKFYASVRLDIRRIASLKQGDEVIGNRARVKVVKNKVAPPFKQTEFDIIFGRGVSKLGEIIDYGVKFDLIDKSGAWFSYGDRKIGQGRENAKKFISENPEILNELEAKIKEQLFPVNEEIKKEVEKKEAEEKPKEAPKKRATRKKTEE
jgi:recombination protein RecA